jgi:hypothetical protein
MMAVLEKKGVPGKSILMARLKSGRITHFKL